MTMRAGNDFAQSFFDGFGLGGLFFPARRAEAPTEAFAPEDETLDLRVVSSNQAMVGKSSHVVEEMYVGRKAELEQRVKL